MDSNQIDDITRFQYLSTNDILIENKLSLGWICLDKCKFNCYKKVTMGEQENIFNIYWRDSTPESRFTFINEMVESEKKIRIQHIFHLNTSRGKVRVCRGCFRATINESKVFILDVLHKKARTVASESSLIPEKFVEVNLEENSPISTSSTKNNNNTDGIEEIDIDDIDDDEDDDDEEEDENADKKNNINEDIADESKINVKNINALSNEKLQNHYAPLKYCSSGCHLLITKERQMEIFQCYSKITTQKIRKKFIQEMVEVKPTISKNSNKRFTTNFYLYANSSMKMQKICKACFIEILHERSWYIHKITEEIFFSHTLKLTNVENDSSENHTNDTANNENCQCSAESTEKWTPLLPCINDCHLKLTVIEQRNIFLTYWQEQLFESRSNFINRRTELTLRENCDTDTNKIIFQTGFYFITQRGRQKVCKYCFYHILDVSKVFVTAILNQKLYKMISK